MSDINNPLIPIGYDIAWSAAALALLLLALAAFLSLDRHTGRMSLSEVLLWAVVIVAFPALGPLAWVFTGRGRVRSRATLPV